MQSHFQNFPAVVGFTKRLAGATSYFGLFLSRYLPLRKRKEFVFQCTKFCADILGKKTKDFLLNYIRNSEVSEQISTKINHELLDGPRIFQNIPHDSQY